MSISEELIAELLKDYKSPEDLPGKNDILKQLQKAVIEKALEAEMTHHLGYMPGANAPSHSLKACATQFYSFVRGSRRWARWWLSWSTIFSRKVGTRGRLMRQT